MPLSALAIALSASAATVLWAPFAGQFRAWLGDTFPGRLVVMVGGGVALAVLVALAVAISRIRDNFVRRYGAIVAAIAIATAYGLAVATGYAEVDVVERVHFVEYGVIGLLFYLVWRHLGDPAIVILPLMAGLIVGSIEEWFQWFIPVRVGEWHDVAIDVVAVACGVLFVLGVDPPPTFRRRLAPASIAWISGVGAITVLVFAFFLNAVHLGYEVSRDGVSFRSHSTADQLDALALDRAARWRTDPPLHFRRFSREDQYMDEGLWHIRARNSADDPWAAWEENRILEMFFAPVLDTPSYVSASGHRWSPEQRQQVEARVAGDRGPYVSHAEPYPVLAWPMALFWSGTGALVLALLLAAYSRFVPAWRV